MIDPEQIGIEKAVIRLAVCSLRAIGGGINTAIALEEVAAEIRKAESDRAIASAEFKARQRSGLKKDYITEK